MSEFEKWCSVRNIVEPHFEPYQIELFRSAYRVGMLRAAEICYSTPTLSCENDYKRIVIKSIKQEANGG